MRVWQVDPYLGKDAAKSEELRAFVAKHDAPHTKGCLFSGAGGGFLMVISDAPVAGAMSMSINHECVCKPYASATLREARDAPKAGPPPSTPPWGEWNPWHLDIYGRPFPVVATRVAAAVAVAAAAAALAAGVAVGKRLK